MLVPDINLKEIEKELTPRAMELLQRIRDEGLNRTEKEQQKTHNTVKPKDKL